MKENDMYRTWIEVDYKAIEKNAKTLRKLLNKDAAMLAVVKSNAYGHGMIASAKAALKGGATWLAVDEITEALDVRKAGIKEPIIVLGYTLPSFYKSAAQNNISLTISSLDSLKTLSAAKLPKKLRIHLKYDSGLHRQGFLDSQIQQALRILSHKDFPAVVEGAYTHFAAMETPSLESFSKMQADAFCRFVGKLEEKGWKPITHASATSGILFSKDYHFDMSRAGISLYGLWPSLEIRQYARDINFTPALSWKTIVTEVKLIEEGEKVGYDLTYEASRDTRMAVIPVGYWHGLSRTLSNTGEVLVCGKRAGIIGRISMDMAMIDVTDIPSVKQGDEVVIIGVQGKSFISAEEFALKSDTINYEVVTRINPLIPRIPA